MSQRSGDVLRPSDPSGGGAIIDELAERRQRLAQIARSAMGITGSNEVSSLRAGIASSRVGWYPLLALGALVVLDEWYSYAFLVLGPEITSGVGISRTALAGAIVAKTLAVTVASLPMAAYVQKVPRRALVSIVTAYGISVFTFLTAFVANIWGLLAVLICSGAANASSRSVHTPLLVDTYPPSVRVRTLSVYRASDAAGSIAAPLLVAVLTVAFVSTWRGVFLAMGIVALFAAIAASWLRDPGFGRWDTSRVREAIRKQEKVEGETTAEVLHLGFFEIARRLFLIPTIRRLLVAWAALGMGLIPLYTFLFFFLEERWGMGPGARGLFFAGLPPFAMLALAWFGRRGDQIFQEDPAKLIRLSSTCLGLGVLLLALGIFSPYFVGMFLLMAGSFALFAVLGPALNMATLSIVPPPMRPHTAALSGIFLAGVGGFGGLILFGGMDRRFGPAGAIASLAIPGIIAALILRTASKTISDDIDRMLDTIIEEEELRALRSRGVHLPMLACRHVDFCYGQLQVLFDVNFTVEEGEMIALLGTNGAGKTTLLRVISGLGLPTRGTVHFSGTDITYIDAERRLPVGIAQVPGGRAVFGTLTVSDNLEIYGYSMGRDNRAVHRGIEATYDAFPRLADRRNQLASTLSGGEQQMLALGKAFILQPRLLLIDELSLGLAPVIVAELLEMVRRINRKGTSVVLVEQSVNIALSLVEHAYFMEKGEIRFDGRAAELLRRPDLLRSVFLQGLADSPAKSARRPDRRRR